MTCSGAPDPGPLQAHIDRKLAGARLGSTIWSRLWLCGAASVLVPPFPLPPTHTAKCTKPTSAPFPWLHSCPTHKAPCHYSTHSSQPACSPFHLGKADLGVHTHRLPITVQYPLLPPHPITRTKKKGASIVIIVVVTIHLTLGSKLFPHMVLLYEISSDAATAPSFAPFPSRCIYPHLGIDISILVLATPKPLRVLGSSMTRSSSMSKPIPIPTCRSLPIQHSLATRCAWACAGRVHTRTWSTARTCAALFITPVS